MAWEKLGSASVGGTTANTSWKFLARGTGSGTTIDTGTFTAKDNLMILAHSVNGTQYMRYNNDTGSNYANKRSEEGGAYQNQTSQTAVSFTRNDNEDMFIVGDLINIAAQEKLGVYHQVSGANKRQEWSHKWANTSDQITRVTMTSDGSNYSSDDEIVVLGMDNDEADSGTNFWQLLGTTTASGGEDTLSVAVDKKYLMFEMYKIQDGSSSADLQFNSDTGNNYQWRISSEGGSDATSTSSSRLVVDRGQVNSAPAFVHGYIVNTASHPKEVIAEAVSQSTAGASNTVWRREFTGRWTNTSSAITSVDMINPESAGNFGSGSFLKVWGAD